MLSQLSPGDWIIFLTAGLVIGLNKSGIKGISIVNVVLLVFVFGAKASTGILLPMLIVGDIFAVIYYNRHAQWKYLIRLLPFMMLGVAAGAWMGDSMSEFIFRRTMAVVIMVSVLVMFWWDQRRSKQVPRGISFAGIMGLTAGFTTMVGNLAGSFVNLFFLAMRVPKDTFIGTTAWLFLIINLFKVPFHVFSWQTISFQTLTVSAIAIPAIFLGLFIGVKILKRVSDQFFRRFILVVTGIGAVLIFFT